MGNGYPHSTIAQILEDIISQLSFDGESHSNIADILLSILNQTSYDKEPYSVLAELFLKLKAKIEGVPFDPYDKETHSVIADILVSILNETEYTDVPQSRIAELLLELKEELESYTEITVSGSIVSFTTNVSKPLVKLKADVEAQQDLHGQEYPYPAGGGKNLFNKLSKDKINGYFNNGVIASYSGTARQVVYIPCNPNTTYTVSRKAVITGERFRVAYTETTPQVGTSILGEISAPNTQTVGDLMSLTITTGASATYLVCWAYWDNATSAIDTLQIELGSTATAYAPYENICPITGWSGANVTRTGKNLLDSSLLLGASGWSKDDDGVYSGLNSAMHTYTTNNDVWKIFKPNYQYTMTVKTKSDVEGKRLYFNFYYTDGTVDGIYATSNDTTWQTLTLASNPNKSVAKLQISYNGSAKCYIDDLQLELGSTATAYSPYNGNTYTIAFGDTYYGCELDVTNGVLRVDKAIADLGDMTWEMRSDGVGDYFRSSKPDNLANIASGVVPDVICPIYKASTSSNVQNYNIAFSVGSMGYTFIRNTDYPSASAFKTAMDGVIIVYPLATPIEIQLTPIEIDALAGDNVIFADTGDVEVTYLYKGTPDT